MCSRRLNVHVKAEMKKVTGGNEFDGYTALECHTPNGVEDWRRTHCSDTTATEDCRAIYPAYGSEVWGECVVVITPG